MRRLQSKPNVIAPASPYPFGKIKDRVGAAPGTPVDEEVYGDMHQFFEKLMSVVGMTGNDLPDNDTNGYQLIDALKKFAKRHGHFIGQVITYSGSLSDFVSGLGTNDWTGFAICDGSNGTPDLRDRFIVGSGSSYGMNTNGGSDAHTIAANELPISSPYALSVGSQKYMHETTSYDADNPGGGSNFTPKYGGISGNSSTPAVSLGSNSGGGQSFSKLPPYYALCFIMRIS
jgi:microcystin-dependent protein